jgi:hypothetical protein
MNLKSKGARRTLAATCSTAVVLAGASFVAVPANAATAKTTGLGLSGSTTITTLDFGAKVGGTLNQSTSSAVAGTGTLAANFEAAAYAYHVTSTLSSTASKLALVLDSYTQPSGITSTVATGSGTAVTNAQLAYAEVTAGSSTAPDDTWKGITTGNTATYYFLADPTTQAHAKDTYITATQPGTYTFHFVDTGASLAGTDDDISSNTITMTVLDGFKATTGGANDTNDDWAPTMSLSSSALKLGAPLTATVPLSALSLTDARGSSLSVGILAKKLGALIGFGFKTSTQYGAAARDLGYSVVTDAVTTNGAATVTSATAAFVAGDTSMTAYTANAVGGAATTIATYNSATSVDFAGNSTADGTSQVLEIRNGTSYGLDFASTTVPAWTPLYESANNTFGASSVSVTIPSNTIVDATTVTAGAGIDQAGLGTFLKSSSPTALSNTPTAAYTSNSVTAWEWGPTAITGTVKATSTSAVAVKTGTSTVDYVATVTAPSSALSGQTVYFTIAPGSTTDSVSGTGTLVSSNTTTGQKVYAVTTDSAGKATFTVTASATAATKSYTVKANLNGVAATASAGTTLISTGNTTVTYAGSKPTTVVDTTSGSGRYPTVGTTSVTLTGQIEDQFGAVSQPDSAYSQNVKVTVAGTDTYVTPSAGKFSYTYTPSTAPTAGSTTSTQYTYTDSGASININDGGGLIHWVPATTAGTVTITAPADGASTGQTAAVGSSAPSGVAVSGSVVDSSSTAIPYKLVTLSGSAGTMFSTSSTGSTGISSTLQVGADASGVFSAYVFYTTTGTAKVIATADSATATSTVTTTDAVDPYKVIVKSASTTPGGTVTISGEVRDAFGNPVPTEYVDLSIGSTGLGTLASSNPQTNSGGVFSTTFTAADSSTEGTATVTAKLRSTVNTAGAAIMTTNPTANSGWATAGVTVAHGEYMGQATLTVAKLQVTTIDSYTVSGGKVTLTGKAVPDVVVEVHAKLTSGGALGWIDSVMSDANGNWTATETISAPMTYIAKTSTSTSSLLAVPFTPETPQTSSLGKPVIKFVTATAKGNGLVYIAVNGNGNQTTLIRYFRWSGTKWVQFKAMKAAPNGARGYTIKASKGKRTFRIAYTNPGYGTAYKNVTVTVK